MYFVARNTEVIGIVQQNNLSCEAKRSEGGEGRVFVILPYVVRYICKNSLDEIQLLSGERQNAANHISISGSLLQHHFHFRKATVWSFRSRRGVERSDHETIPVYGNIGEEKPVMEASNR